MKKATFKEAYYYGALLYAFLIPFHQQMATFALGIWVLLSLVCFDKKALVGNKLLLWLPVMYLLYFMGIFTAENPSFRFMETKLSLLAFPLIFFLQRYPEKQRNSILRFFVYGLAISGIICLAQATYHSFAFENGTVVFAPNVLDGKGAIESILYGGNYFFGSYLSIFHQTVYFALYLTVGLIILLFKSKLFSIKKATILSFFFIMLLFLVSNKASLITLGAILLLRTLTLQTSISKKMAFLGALGLAFVALIALNPRTRLSVEKVYNGALTIDKNARYGFSTRLLSWDAALDLVKAKPIIGYGSGDSQAKLNMVYQEKEYIFPLKESYNAHNQWLQTWLETGVLGVLVLGIIFISLFRRGSSISEATNFIVALALILFLNTLFESIFNRFSGVSFFSFIVCFVLTLNKGKEESIV